MKPNPKNQKNPTQKKQKSSSTDTKEETASSSGRMGGMIGEGRADEGSRSGMKGER